MTVTIRETDVKNSYCFLNPLAFVLNDILSIYTNGKRFRINIVDASDRLVASLINFASANGAKIFLSSNNDINIVPCNQKSYRLISDFFANLK